MFLWNLKEEEKRYSAIQWLTKGKKSNVLDAAEI